MSTELGNKWTGSPFPVLGMFCDLNHSSIVQKVDLIGFLNNDVQVLQGLLATIGKWNEAADAIFTTDGLDIDMGEDDKTYPISGIDYTSMSGPTSVRRLSTALYDVLHSNWPCNVAEHDHNGKLGECYEANFYLDPHWISGNATGDGLFIVLRAPGLLQESRVCLHNSAALETHTPACLTSHEDSHPFCLHFTVDGESQLWDQQQLVRPLEVFHPEHDYVGQDLRDLFSSFRPAYTTKRVLGVILARTVLHLFEGPWMNSHMSIEDFAIFCRRDNGETDPSFDKLFLSTKFQSGQNANTPSRRGYSVHPFPTILALGIVLMQIELADDLEDLYTEPWFGNLQHRPFDLAKRLLQQCQLRLHMGSGMVRAARFCTDRTSLASFTRSNSDRLFSTPDFTKAYYQNIVRPLEDDLVSGASWSWAEVQQLKPFNSDNTTYLKVRSQRVPLAVQPRDTRETSGSSSQKCKHGFHKPATRLPTLSDDHMGELSATYGDIPKGDTSKSVSFRSLKHSVASENAPVSVDSISRQKMALDHTLSSRFPKKPQNRDEFEIAIICALPKEADAVISIFDQVWDEDYCAYGKASNDPNSYTAGVIGGHNVVVAHQSHMGKANAATVASKCTMSFTKVKLAFVVGICGGAPRHAETNEEILLGDVVISKGVIQYDFGRQYPSQMVRKIAVEDVLGRPNAEVGSILAKLETTKIPSVTRDQIQTNYFLRYIIINIGSPPCVMCAA
ncbi:hypothetical protein N8T08_000428 [Aspergillus melleus]|uniref:Uncharacterized protein n=1 Tax=Aspergillus melleus TaxID=138277 RepID=A0ACC3BBB4_9EURO|nr:hypothetical protein N8T08_000428 [Aspergillus melleus]